MLRSFFPTRYVVIVSPGVKIGRTGYFLAATALLNTCFSPIEKKWIQAKLRITINPMVLFKDNT